MRYRTAIVTGASRGLGRSIAAALAAAGLRVLLAARSRDELERVAEELAKDFPDKVAFTVLDLSAPDSIRQLAAACRQRFGDADVLINNAGVGAYKPFLEWSEKEILQTVAVNLSGLMLCTHAVLPGMIAARRGYIINIASDLSRRFLPRMAPYVASKFAVLGFSGSILREVKEHGVKVTTILPGIIDTYFNDSEAGSRDETWALRPAVIADTVIDLLRQGEHVILDEVTIHPMQQDF